MIEWLVVNPGRTLGAVAIVALFVWGVFHDDSTEKLKSDEIAPGINAMLSALVLAWVWFLVEGPPI